MSTVESTADEATTSGEHQEVDVKMNNSDKVDSWIDVVLRYVIPGSFFVLAVLIVVGTIFPSGSSVAYHALRWAAYVGNALAAILLFVFFAIHDVFNCFLSKEVLIEIKEETRRNIGGTANVFTCVMVSLFLCAIIAQEASSANTISAVQDVQAQSAFQTDDLLPPPATVYTAVHTPSGLSQGTQATATAVDQFALYDLPRRLYSGQVKDIHSIRWRDSNDRVHSLNVGGYEVFNSSYAEVVTQTGQRMIINTIPLLSGGNGICLTGLCSSTYCEPIDILQTPAPSPPPSGGQGRRLSSTNQHQAYVFHMMMNNNCQFGTSSPDCR